MPHVPDQHPAPPAPVSDNVVCHTARFETRWPQPDTAIVSGLGELDAANGIDFVGYALRHSDRAHWLVVDLSGLTFFSTAGFSALHTLNVQCVSEDIRWALVPSRAVDRLLRICDPDHALPTCADVPTALTVVQQEPPRSLQLVAESR